MARRISKPLPGAFLVSIYLAMLFSPFHSFADALAIEPGIAGNVTMQKRDDDYACFDPTPNVLANECSCYNIAPFRNQGTAVAIPLQRYFAAIDVFCADFASRYTFGRANNHPERRGMAYFYAPDNLRTDNPDRKLQSGTLSVPILLAVSQWGTDPACAADFNISTTQCTNSLQNLMSGCQPHDRVQPISVGGWGKDRCLSWTLDPWASQHNPEVYTGKITGHMDYPLRETVADDDKARKWNKDHRDQQSYVM